MAKSTKPKSSTSFKETDFGILPRAKAIQLEKLIANALKESLEKI